MAGKLPWFKCKPGPWLGALAALPPDQGLLYSAILLRIYENGGPIKDSAEALGRRVNLPASRARKAFDALLDEGKILMVGGLLDSETTHETLEEQNCARENAKSAGKKSAEKRAEKMQENQCSASTPVERPLNGTPTIREEDRELELFADANNSGAGAPPVSPAKKPKPKPKKADAEFVEILSAVLPAERIDGILACRKAKKLANTRGAAEGLLAEFHIFGDPIAAAREMELRGWGGFKASWVRDYPNVIAHPAARPPREERIERTREAINELRRSATEKADPDLSGDYSGPQLEGEVCSGGLP